MPSPMDQRHGAGDVSAARRDDLTRAYAPSTRGGRIQTAIGVAVLVAIVVLVVLAIA